MSRLFAIFCLSAAEVFAQFQNLATIDDGSFVVFSSSLRMAGTDQPTWEKLFRIDGTGLGLYAERDQAPPPQFSFVTSHFRITGAEFSGDGRVAALITLADCAQVGSYCLVQQPKYQSEISGLGGQQPLTLSGQIRISRNGRYAVLCCDGAMDGPTALRDLTTGTTVQVPLLSLATRPAISSTGIAVIAYPGGSLHVLGFDGSREIATATPALQAAVDDGGTTAFYVGSVSGGSLLARVDLSSGHEQSIFQAADLSLIGVSNSDDRVAFLSSAGTGVAQLFTIASDGSGLRAATQDTAGIAEAVLAGGGDVAYAVTFAGRVLRIDLAANTVTELIGPTLAIQIPCTCRQPQPVAGSAYCIGGRGLVGSAVSAAPPLPARLGGLQLLLDGQPVPLLSAAPAQACFQVPWNTGTGVHALSAVADSDPRFEPVSSGALQMNYASFANFLRLGPQYPPSVSQDPYSLAAHQDFTALVTRANPAAPGEVLHFYMTGLGAVSPTVQPGDPAPSAPLARAVTPPVCSLATFHSGGQTAVEVAFAGLAPGLAGYYQMDLRLPDQVPISYGEALLRCSVGAPYAGEGIWIPMTSQ
jgi:uncharacterized protein (TIGR03437 family)